MKPRLLFTAGLLLLTTLAAPAPAAAPPGGEEFVGPFPSWRDLKRDYGAAGDGRADDTAALQRALDDLTHHEKFCVLYLPSGAYRLTQTVKTVRKAHTDCQGVAIIGQSPETTTLVWDGPEGGTLFQWDAWYSTFSRLSLDGRNRADTLLLYGPAFSTYNQTTDVWFRDAKSGLVFGGPHTHGQAENEVLRCRFSHCDTGVQTVNWNSMDVWVWYGRFEDCGRGVHNVMGNWHVWQSLFLRSRTADLSIQNLMAFSVVNNVSVGSRCFLDFSTGHTWGSPTSVTGNRVSGTTGDCAVKLSNAGPYLVVDNAFRLPEQAKAVSMTWGDQTLAGNRYSKADAVVEHGRFRRIDEKTVEANAIPEDLPALPPPPPQVERKVFEVAAPAAGPGGREAGSADAIQHAIDQAAALTGQRPVVHLPMGAYRVEKTLVIPAGCDLQLVGDGAGETATRLNWAGPADGMVLRLQGPGRATLRDFYVHAPQSRAVVVERADQPGGRIFADQLNTSGPSSRPAAGRERTAALRVSGLRHTNVLMRALQGSGNAGAWVEALGPGGDAPRAEAPPADAPANQISIFTGATGSAAGQYDVRSGGRLVVRGVYHERSSDALTGLRLTDRGVLSIDATRFSYATSDKSPTIEADGFRGQFTLATCMLMPVETKQTCRFSMRGDGSRCSILALNDQFWVEQPGTTADTVWQNAATPPARGGLVGCNINTNNKEAAPKGFEFLPNTGDDPDPAKSNRGAGPLADRGGVDDATILRHLAPLREARVWLPGSDPETPPGATDVRIYRIMVSGGRDASVEFRAD